MLPAPAWHGARAGYATVNVSIKRDLCQGCCALDPSILKLGLEGSIGLFSLNKKHQLSLELLKIRPALSIINQHNARVAKW